MYEIIIVSGRSVFGHSPCPCAASCHVCMVCLCLCIHDRIDSIYNRMRKQARGPFHILYIHKLNSEFTAGTGPHQATLQCQLVFMVKHLIKEPLVCVVVCVCQTAAGCSRLTGWKINRLQHKTGSTWSLENETGLNQSRGWILYKALSAPGS